MDKKKMNSIKQDFAIPDEPPQSITAVSTTQENSTTTKSSTLASAPSRSPHTPSTKRKDIQLETTTSGFTSPRKRRQLFHSPSSEKKKTYSDNKIDLTGYIINVTELCKAKKSDEYYFDLKVKTSPKDVKTIRLMKRSNPNVNRHYYVSKQGKPVILTKLTQSDSDVIFYNQHFGSTLVVTNALPFKCSDVEFVTLNELNEKTQGKFNVVGCIRWVAGEKEIASKDNDGNSLTKRLREGVIMDNTSFLPITIWQENIDVITEGHCFIISNVSIRQYFVKKLTTTTSSSVTASDKIDPGTLNWTGIELTDFTKVEADAKAKANPTIELADILSVSIKIFPVCSNPACNKKVEVISGETFVRCGSCNHKLSVKKLAAGFLGELDVSDNKNNVVTLTVFPEVLNAYFNKADVVEEYFHDTDKLEEELLCLTDIDVTYSSAKLLVSEIKDHEFQDDEIVDHDHVDDETKDHNSTNNETGDYEMAA